MKNNSELNLQSIKIDKLIASFNRGQLKIPTFQRGFVWSASQVIELLESIYKNFPVGSFLLWETENEIETRKGILTSLNEQENNYSHKKIVLDGQQRLTSIISIFGLHESNISFSENFDKNFFDFSFDCESLNFIPTKDIQQKTDSVIDVNSIFNIPRIGILFSNLNRKYHPILNDLILRFSSYEIPVINMRRSTIHEVADIFERINNTGTSLGLLDLMTAYTWTSEFHLLDKIENLKDKLKSGYENIPDNIFVKALSAHLYNNVSTKSIISIEKDLIQNEWDLIINSTLKAVDFLTREIRCPNLKFLPFQQQLILIIKFFSIEGRPSDKQLHKLKSWFWYSSFSGAYNKGLITEKINNDIQLILNIRSDIRLNIESINLEINFQNIKWSINNYLTKSFLLLMANNSPLDLVTKLRIELDNTFSFINQKEYHHVFPQAFLQKMEYDFNEINSLMNFVILTSDSNKVISDDSPANYFNKFLEDDPNLNKILAANILPNQFYVYRENNYTEYIRLRALLVIKTIKEKCQSLMD